MLRGAIEIFNATKSAYSSGSLSVPEHGKTIPPVLARRHNTVPVKLFYPCTAMLIAVYWKVEIEHQWYSPIGIWQETVEATKAIQIQDITKCWQAQDGKYTCLRAIMHRSSVIPYRNLHALRQHVGIYILHYSVHGNFSARQNHLPVQLFCMTHPEHGRAELLNIQSSSWKPLPARDQSYLVGNGAQIPFPMKHFPNYT